MTPNLPPLPLSHSLRPLLHFTSLLLLVSGPMMAAETPVKTTPAQPLGLPLHTQTCEEKFLLGKAYAEGRGTKQSYSKAAGWWTKAAGGGNDRAQYNLAMLYLEGKGVKRDPDLAVKWLEMASAQGNARATGLLGYFLCLGTGTAQDEEKGKALLREAVAKGDPCSMVMLGDRLLIPRAKGSISAVDEEKFNSRSDSQIKEAVELLQHAADAGMPRACRLLAERYALDKSDPENSQTAARWYFKGAWLGEAYCQRQTALEYLGWNDPIDAYPWILLAFEQKVPGSKEILDNCAASLTPPQLEEGKRQAEEIKAWISWRQSRANY